MAVSLSSGLHCTANVTCWSGGDAVSSQRNYAYDLSSVSRLDPLKIRCLHLRGKKQSAERRASREFRAVAGKDEPDDQEDEPSPANVDPELFRQQMERMLSSHDDRFEGKDLATLIRRKYGRSYDVQLVKKEFMGRQLLAMNVMWKYREQRSFPLTEEEYLLHLDHVAQNLRGWGAVSYVRDSLEKTRERPRIGKAVSIFIEVDETGNRQNEWIQR